MPWRETGSPEERLEFVQDWEAGGLSMSALCRKYGVSRRVGYKWIRRCVPGSALESLRDRSSRPRSNARAVSPELEDSIVAARKLYPYWGPRKIKLTLAGMNPQVLLPAVSTFGAIFKRNGLVKPRRRRAHVPPFTQPFAGCSAPNDVWCADFKGSFPVGRARCHPLTIMDAHSRYLIRVDGLRKTRRLNVQNVFASAFLEFGMPRAIRTDNGPPFASTGAGGLSRLSVWWVKLGIVPERIEPGRPEQNGRHERMHRTLKLETASPPQVTFPAQQRSFDLFRKRYNDDRPHEALGQMPPASVYQPSPRSYEPFRWRAPDPEYGDDFERHRVDEHGNVRWRGRTLRVSIALAHEVIGLRRANANEDLWELFFGPIALGRVYSPKGRQRVVKLIRPTKVLPTSSV
jgi:putative transposase